jgi:hypothetical protein
MKIPSVVGLLVAAIAGALTLGLEVLVARTLAPALGSGSVVWSALLSTALGGLAVGNFLGGWLAGRHRAERLLFGSLTVAALALLLCAELHRAVVGWAAGHDLAVGAWLANVTIQGVPMLCLGLLTPVLLSLGRDGRASPERWAGLVLAAGSLGGVLGALAVGLWLLPALGLTRTYLCLVALAGAGTLAVGLGIRWGRATFAGVFLLAAAIADGSGVRETSLVQSRYGQIEVLSHGENRVLLIDGLPQTAMPLRVYPWAGLQNGYLLAGSRIDALPRQADLGPHHNLPWEPVLDGRIPVPYRVLTDDRFPSERDWWRVAHAWRRVMFMRRMGN